MLELFFKQVNSEFGLVMQDWTVFVVLKSIPPSLKKYPSYKHSHLKIAKISLLVRLLLHIQIIGDGQNNEGVAKKDVFQLKYPISVLSNGYES